MRIPILVFLSLLIFQNVIADPLWYENGSLHKSTLSQWKDAEFNNKLATASDWALVIENVQKVVRDSNNIDTAKIFANDLVSCIDDFLESGKLQEETADIAFNCMLAMGWID